MDKYCEKIKDYLKDFEEMDFFVNFYLNNVEKNADPEKALIRAMDECIENMETELQYNYSESLDYNCINLSDAQVRVISYLKTNPEKIFIENEKKELDSASAVPIPIPIKHHWQSQVSCSP